MTNPSAVIGAIVLWIQLIVAFDVFVGYVDLLSHLSIDQLAFLKLGSNRSLVGLHGLPLAAQRSFQVRVRQPILLLYLIDVDINVLISNFDSSVANFRIEQLFRNKLLQYLSIAAVDSFQRPDRKFPRQLALCIGRNIGQSIRLTIDHRDNLFNDSALQ